MPDLHVVYAVDENLTKYRISEPMPWGAATQRWTNQDKRVRAKHKLRVTLPDTEGASAAVRYLAVRSADDPGWPAHARRGKLVRKPDAPHSVLIRRAIQPPNPSEPWACAIATDTDSLVCFAADPVNASAEAHRKARQTGLI